MTPFKDSITCCTLVGALDRVNCVLLPSNASVNVDIKKLPIDWASSHAELVPLYTRSLPVLVLKNKSPLSRELVGFDEPTLYLDAKSFMSLLNCSTSASLASSL